MAAPFYPGPNKTVNINVGAASARVLLAETDGAVDVRIMNNGTATVWVNFGDANVTADTTDDFPVGPGVIEVVRLDNIGVGGIYVAAIAAGATGRVYFTPGIGS